MNTWQLAAAIREVLAARRWKHVESGLRLIYVIYLSNWGALRGFKNKNKGVWNR